MFVIKVTEHIRTLDEVSIPLSGRYVCNPSQGFDIIASIWSKSQSPYRVGMFVMLEHKVYEAIKGKVSIPLSGRYVCNM